MNSSNFLLKSVSFFFEMNLAVLYKGEGAAHNVTSLFGMSENVIGSQIILGKALASKASSFFIKYLQ